MFARNELSRCSGVAVEDDIAVTRDDQTKFESIEGGAVEPVQLDGRLSLSSRLLSILFFAFDGFIDGAVKLIAKNGICIGCR